MSSESRFTIGSIVQLTQTGVKQTTDCLGEVTRRAVDVEAALLESGIRAKLIELGWTPPSEKKEEVMRVGPGEDSGSAPVAPPPVEMAGGDHLCALGRFPSWRDCPEHSGDMHTNPGKVNMTDETCKENAETLNSESACLTVQSVPLPTPWHHPGTYGSAPFDYYTADQLRAYGDERERASLARVAELEAKLAEAEASDCESLAMYRRARERANRLAEAIKTHNDGLAASCDALAAARQTMCAHYKSKGRKCHDCPRDHEIDAAIAAGGLDGVST